MAKKKAVVKKPKKVEAIKDDTPQLKTVLDLIHYVDMLPVIPRPRPDDHDAELETMAATLQREYAGRVGHDLAKAVRRLLVPDFRVWARERYARAEHAGAVDHGDATFGDRIEQAEALRQALLHVVPSLTKLTRTMEAIATSGATRWEVERGQTGPFMERRQPGDKHVFAVIVTPVDILLHQQSPGVYDASHAFRGAAHGDFGSYGSECSHQQQYLSEHPIVVGEPAVALWRAMQGFTAEVATSGFVAETNARSGNKVIDGGRASPNTEDAAATWNVNTAKTAVALRAAAAKARAAAEVTATALEALADRVSARTWPPAEVVDGDAANP